eukprot:COSAG04_NODE_13493_length_603_cov_79.523810_1_plen_78_part_10
MLQIVQRARKRAGLVFGAIQPGRLEAFSRVKNNLNGLTIISCRENGKAYQSGGSGKDGSPVTATLWPGLTVRRVVMPA